MNTLKIPAGYELVGVSASSGTIPSTILHLRNKETGVDELTVLTTSEIPRTWVTSE